MEIPDLIKIAKATAEANGLDPALVCAVIEQESSWNEWAVRYEPAFKRKYVDPLELKQTEAVTRSTSWGLMQLMGQCAREIGYKDKYLPSLCDPVTNLEWGCKWLVKKINQAKGDVNKGLLYWNGGGNLNYPAEVLARMEKYQ